MVSCSKGASDKLSALNSAPYINSYAVNVISETVICDPACTGDHTACNNGQYECTDGYTGDGCSTAPGMMLYFI